MMTVASFIEALEKNRVFDEVDYNYIVKYVLDKGN